MVSEMGEDAHGSGAAELAMAIDSQHFELSSRLKVVIVEARKESPAE
jgi:hypothetical protein